MFPLKINDIVAIFLISLCFSEEYNFNLNIQVPNNFQLSSWKHDAANSSIFIQGVSIDVLQWQIAADNIENINVNLNNQIWEDLGLIKQSIDLPPVKTISEVSIFRDTPTAYIRIIPWLIKEGRIKILTKADINITYESANFPIKYKNPFLINSNDNYLKRNSSNMTSYLIICPNKFLNAAQILANLHSSEVIDSLQLNTEIITTEQISNDISGEKIREYIINRLNNDLNNSAFLLLFGDENYIPPIYDPSGTYPSDDFYSTSETNMYAGKPMLISGRIPISFTEDAFSIVEKIRNYILYPTPGIWKSKIALIADDMNQSCSYSKSESSHTILSNALYDSLKALVPTKPFFGIEYNLQYSNSGCTYPDLTSKLIRTIYNGLGIINYIGHGSSETWAGEKILTKNRDLPLINANEGKLAIWIAGTCSFGHYISGNSFMEELLIKKNGAIAVVATTGLIGYNENSNYIKSLFGFSNNDGLIDFINNKNNYRLGEIIHKAKNIHDTSNDYYKFHTFGDPALILPLPKKSTNIIDNLPNKIPIIEQNYINLNSNELNSNLIVKGIDNEQYYLYNSDSILYSIPGETYAQIASNTLSFCFRLPIDANTCENCATIQIYSDLPNNINGLIQTKTGISIEGNNIFYSDATGPNIAIKQGNNLINDGSSIHANQMLSIIINDTSGINLMETIGHGIQYKFNDNTIEKITGDEFFYNNCDSGFFNIAIPSDLSKGKHNFYLEAWDGVNNKTFLDIELDILNYFSSNQKYLDNILPIPSPFSDFTEFTMHVLNPPMDIIITIYSILGQKVIELNNFEATSYYISIPWDGKDQFGNEIANGAYYFHVKAQKDTKVIFEDMFKLAKVK